MSITTYEQVELMTGPQLVSFHNEHAVAAGQPFVVRFSDRATGVKRAWAVYSAVVSAAARKAEAVAPRKSPAKKAAVKAIPEKAPRASFASRCRELFAAGMTNAEAWAILQPEFGKPDSARWHVAWHRSEAARRAKREGSA